MRLSPRSRRNSISLHDQLDLVLQLVGELAGVGTVRRLGEDMHQRLVRIGQDLDQPRSSNALIPSRRSSSRSARRSLSSGMTRPLRAHGHGSERWTSDGTGSSATRLGTDRSACASSSSSLERLATASYPGRCRGTRSPADRAGEDHVVASCRPRRSLSECGVRVTCRPLFSTSVSTRLVTVTGTAIVPVRPVSTSSRTKSSSAVSSGTRSPRSSTTRSPPGRTRRRGRRRSQ